MSSIPAENEKETIVGNFITIGNDIKKQNDRLRDLLEVNSDFIWETDCEGVYTYASPKSLDILGYKEEEILGKTPFDFMAPEDAERVSGMFSKIRHSQRSFFCVEYRNIHKNGHPIFIESSGVPIIGGEGQFSGYHGIDRDISRRKRAIFDIRQIASELEDRVQERTMALEEAMESLQNREKEIEELNKYLTETNQALGVLARNIDRKKEEMEKKIHKILKTKLLPIVRQLKCDKGCKKRLAEIEILNMYLNEIISETTCVDEINALLSQQELRVTTLIKDGLTSQNIADILNISIETVKTHRRNIRRKLKIQNSSINFSSYLKSKFAMLKGEE